MTSTASKIKAPFGTWGSPLKAKDIAGGALRLGQVLCDHGNIYWLEGRPTEGGRSTVVCKTSSGSNKEMTESPFNVRSLVHEYGGGAYLPVGNLLFFTNYKDQRIYVVGDGFEAKPVTVEAPLRYAAMTVDQKRQKIYCVVEDHGERSESDSEPENYIVSINIADVESDRFEPQKPINLASSNDFYAEPTVSPGGKYLAWITWNHPNMPWDGTNLVAAEIKDDGKKLGDLIDIAGGEEESIFQPQWSPEGSLHFVSDRSGFWNIYRLNSKIGEDLELINLTEMDKEFGMPLWVFGMSTYAFLENGAIVCAYSDKGIWKLGHIKDGKFSNVDTEFTDIQYLTSDGKKVAMLGSSPKKTSSVVEYQPESRIFEIVKESASIELDPEFISTPEIIEFPTKDGRTAHAFYYPPTNKEYSGVDGELPPLLVKSHGGPTGSTSTGLNLGFQYWTSRGFGIVDVNYGGSTGYGREYMKRLELNWGIVDVDDCENAALYLVSKGKADANRLAITGGSAGGYTTLCVLTYKDTFSAGASHYGIGDLEALAKDTHKFESRYGDRLIGPYPEMKNRYIERSPIHFTDKLNCPLIVFQGLEDKVVPPNQAESMVEAVKAKKLPVAYIAYEGEQHGFRKSENIERTIESEFYFYSRIFGFEPKDKLNPVEIFNSEALNKN